MVPAVSDRIPRVPPYSGYRYLLTFLLVRDFHSLWFTFPGYSSSVYNHIAWSYNPIIAVTTMVWALPLPLAATQGIDVSFFSSSYLDVSVQRVRPPFGAIGLQPIRLPHSEIRGSSLVCKSPRLIAAYHVLRRLQEPRHPPYALLYFLNPYTPFCCVYETLSHP